MILILLLIAYTLLLSVTYHVYCIGYVYTYLGLPGAATGVLGVLQGSLQGCPGGTWGG